LRRAASVPGAAHSISRRRYPIKCLILTFALSGLAFSTPISPVLAQADPDAIVRPGDRDLSCEALSTELGALAAEPATPVRKKKKGLGFLRMLGAVSPLGGMAGGAGGALASSAMSTVGNVAATEGQGDRQGEGTARPNITAQRKQWLNQIYADKKC
jgi:hypothetical protein